MSTFDISMFNNIAGLVLGIAAWILACSAILSKKSYVSHRFSVCSFGLCAFSLLLQLFEVSNRVNAGDFSAIADTIRAVIIAALVLVGITIILNAVALIKQKGKA